MIWHVDRVFCRLRVRPIYARTHAVVYLLIIYVFRRRSALARAPGYFCSDNARPYYLLCPKHNVSKYMVWLAFSYVSDKHIITTARAYG